ncbi:NAD(P)-dependent oxidoreductase [bacterium]|nr:NAD(P)-dependent oxidoreductase [bacterium]
MATAKKKKILVTGGVGLIGHNVIKELQKSRKNDVQAVDAFTTYGSLPKEELEYLFAQRLKAIDTNTQIFKEDICVPEIDEIFKTFQPDVVIHLASFPNEAAVKDNPIEAARTMCVGTANLLDCCTRHKTAKFVYISSSMVYGDFDEASEETALNPCGQYSIWKIAGEELVKEYNRTTGQSYVIIRPTAVYGPLDVSNRVIGTFFKRAIADETLYVNGKDQTLDFTYVKDTATGIALASVTKDVTGTYNISRGKKEKILDVANAIVKLVGKGTVKVRAKKTNMPSRGTLDCTSAMMAFKFNPKIEIEEGLENYYEWIKDSVYWSKKTV